mmetsp:Transcript_43422/g.72366  ORF Transcript_43422/g.72366 Transcript_43422/m.72366 type:complete len:431 (+) Transcript_43422:486-1778(+)|eukprot:CAMPEP_0198207808 /NCGR_PEP_ID=MMETSP1445-20131203/11226_1 /TAXON_ID=36898 /ORGANISM="Pyramimonas sp., Strain CCMP2087" /LENGTH=430 /DNA_ID=CAMNT_0043880967 /DNA_START=473 /DNA_END=1765 /DNA_ORIENTATION=+
MQHLARRSFGLVARRGYETNAAGNIEIPKERLLQLIRCEATTMASMESTQLSVNNLLKLWDQPSINALKLSTKFLYHELPIRYAVRTKELEMAPSWMKTKNFEEVLQLYAKSFEELRMMQEPTDAEGLFKFEQLLLTIKRRQAGVVPMLGAVVHEVRSQGLLDSTKHTKYINDYLNQFFTSRISSELLVSQHLALHQAVHDSDSRFNTDKTRAGLLHKSCKPAEIIEDAAEHATRLCDRQFGQAPEIRMRGHLGAALPYFPDQLYYISFELIKNAMRAITEFHADKSVLPPVTITIACPSDSDSLGIMVEDEGGGIPLHMLHKVWQYSFTTVKKQKIEESLAHAQADGGTGLYMVSDSDTRADPLAGLGFGLPLARLYAQAFGGQLKLMSLAGHGTNAYLHLDRTGNVIRTGSTRHHTLKYVEVESQFPH